MSEHEGEHHEAVEYQLRRWQKLASAVLPPTQDERDDVQAVWVLLERQKKEIDRLAVFVQDLTDEIKDHLNNERV